MRKRKAKNATSGRTDPSFAQTLTHSLTHSLTHFAPVLSERSSRHRTLVQISSSSACFLVPAVTLHTYVLTYIQTCSHSALHLANLLSFPHWLWTSRKYWMDSLLTHSLKYMLWTNTNALHSRFVRYTKNVHQSAAG